MIYLNDHLDDFDFNAALPLLSEQRRQQALRFRHELGRKQCAAAYLLLFEGLQQEYGISERPLFDYGEHGKPVIVGHPDIHFNLSHCREAAVCILSPEPVGIDIESIRPYREQLVRYTMNDDELQRIKQADNPEAAFTRLWTMKESALKLTGEGISNNMRDVLLRDDLLFETTMHDRYIYTVCRSNSSTSRGTA